MTKARSDSCKASEEEIEEGTANRAAAKDISVDAEVEKRTALKAFMCGKFKLSLNFQLASVRVELNCEVHGGSPSGLGLRLMSPLAPLKQIKL